MFRFVEPGLAEACTQGFWTCFDWLAVIAAAALIGAALVWFFRYHCAPLGRYLFSAKPKVTIPENLTAPAEVTEPVEVPEEIFPVSSANVVFNTMVIYADKVTTNSDRTDLIAVNKKLFLSPNQDPKSSQDPRKLKRRHETWSKMVLLEDNAKSLPDSAYVTLDVILFTFSSPSYALPLEAKIANMREDQTPSVPIRLCLKVPQKGGRIAIDRDATVNYTPVNDHFDPEVRAVLVKFVACCLNYVISRTAEMLDLKALDTLPAFQIYSCITLEDFLVFPWLIDFSDAKDTFIAMMNHRETSVSYVLLGEPYMFDITDNEISNKEIAASIKHQND